MENYYLWSFPGCPVKVRLSVSVIAELQQRLAKGGDAAREEGLLLGGLSEDVTQIEDCRPVPDNGFLDRPDALARLIASAGQDRVAGYYRFERQGALRLLQSDLPLAESLFPKPHQVILLIQNSASGPARGAFFFRDNGRINGDFCFLEFPFDKAYLPAVGAQAPSVATPAAARSVAPRRRGRIWLMAAGMLLAAAAAAAWSIPDSWTLLQRLAPPETAGLGLRAERRNGDVILTWNRRSAAVRRATSGMVSIEDGAVTRILQLDAALLRGGSILYSPLTDRVQLELTLVRQEGPATEIVMAILPPPGAAAPPLMSDNTTGR